MMNISNHILKINVHLVTPYRIVVRKGYKPGGEILAPKEDGIYLLDEGIYRVMFESEGFCSQEHMVLLGANTAEGGHTLDIYPIKLRGEKAEFKGSLFYLPESFENNLYNDKLDEIIKGYCFNTPGFSEDKGSLCFTKAEEFKMFSKDISKVCSYMRVFYIEDLTIVFISKDAATMPLDIDEAARKTRQNERLGVVYKAQAHGTEPASGEGALAFITEAANGNINDLLDVMDIWVIPCCNPVGTDRFERDCNGININRDALNMECKETRILHRLFMMVLPEVVIDAHTFTRANSISSPYLDRALLDVRLSPAQSKNIDKAINKITVDITNDVIKTLRKEGVRSGYYGDTADPSITRVFYGLFNTCSFLLESEGSRSGKLHFKRNVWCQLNAVTRLLKVIGENKEHIKDTVSASREKLLKIGTNESLGREGKVFVLRHGKSEKRFFKTKQAAYDFNGNIVDEENTIYFPKRSITLKKTVRPQEYLIFKDYDRAEEVIELLNRHSIDIVEDSDKYIVFTNQITSNIISTLLEHSSGDAENIFKQGK